MNGNCFVFCVDRCTRVCLLDCLLDGGTVPCSAYRDYFTASTLPPSSPAVLFNPSLHACCFCFVSMSSPSSSFGFLCIGMNFSCSLCVSVRVCSRFLQVLFHTVCIVIISLLRHFPPVLLLFSSTLLFMLRCPLCKMKLLLALGLVYCFVCLLSTHLYKCCALAVIIG